MPELPPIEPERQPDKHEAADEVWQGNTPPLAQYSRANVVTQGMPHQESAVRMEDVRRLLLENTSELRRMFRRFDVTRKGTLPPDLVVRGIMNTFTLNPQRDLPVVRSICASAAAPDGGVRLDKLLEGAKSVPQPRLNATRYKAAGIMDPTIQKATTGAVVTPLGYTYEGPPFAVTSDADQMTSIIQSFHTQRKALLEEKLKKFSQDGVWLTHREFLEAVPAMDKYQVPEYEVVALIHALDPGRKRGKINIQQFLNQFGPEYMKNKSSRATIGGNIDGNSNTLQWPSSLTDTYDRKLVMQELRTRKASRLQTHRPHRRQHAHRNPHPPPRGHPPDTTAPRPHPPVAVA